MRTETKTPVARLLEETLAAHSVYETTVLGGVYDERWSNWYAMYLLEHGLSDLLHSSDPMSTARLAAILGQLDVEFRREQPEDEWPAFYARRLSAAAPSIRAKGGTRGGGQ